ncbi:hypothetical protein Ocin01_12780 [Orchesella cincta]|uniref:Uncharacterized protein n=1 Tax=Orchesella cincta TaxID=48709 RepID=A0A1D2MM29_ORCCI|nr:hypothetical protein Ocin01_12780 [Orchesella cincta]
MGSSIFFCCICLLFSQVVLIQGIPVASFPQEDNKVDSAVDPLFLLSISGESGEGAFNLRFPRAAIVNPNNAPQFFRLDGGHHDDHHHDHHHG